MTYTIDKNYWVPKRMITVQVPAEEVDMVITNGTPCGMSCMEECAEMQEQLFAILEGWA